MKRFGWNCRYALGLTALLMGAGTLVFGQNFTTAGKLKPDRGVAERFGGSAAPIRGGEQPTPLPFLEGLPFSLRPSLTISESWSDNLYLEAGGETKAFYTTISPSLQLVFPFGKHQLDLGYRADLILCGSDPEYTAKHHFIDAGVNFDLAHGLSISLANNLSLLSNPPDFNHDIRDDYFRNVTGVSLSYQLATKTKASIAYSHDVTNYNRRALHSSDFTIDAVEVTLWYKFLPKTSALIDYAFQSIDNTRAGTDNQAHTTSVGLEWDPTSKLSGRAQVGYLLKNYDHSSSRDFYGLSALVNLKYKYSQKLSFTFQGFRKVNETSTEAGNVNNGDYYISAGAKLGANYKMGEKVSLFASTAVVKDRFDGSDAQGRRRNDVLSSYEIGLRYTMTERLTLFSRYQFQINDSNIDSPNNASDNDYQENLVQVGLSLNL